MIRTLVAILKSFSKKELYAFLGGAFVALISGILLIAHLITSITTSAPSQGGIFTEGIIGQASYLNPILARDKTPDKDMVALLFADTLRLSESIKPSEDFRKWNVRLKENISWQDGSPITSDDVIFTIQLIKNTDTASPLYDIWQNISVERISEREIEFRLASGYAPFENILQDLRPLPKKYFADIAPGNIRMSEYNLKPIGSGPFMFKSFEQRADGFITSYTLVRNDAYEKIQSRPYIDTFEIKFFENKETALHAFNVGSLSALGTSDPGILDEIKLRTHVRSISTYTYYALFLNPNLSPLLGDLTVRTALSHALDIPRIIQESMGGNGEQMAGAFPPALGIPYTPPAPQDPSELLTQAGWSVQDDVWQKNGTPLAFTVTVPDMPLLKNIAQNMRDQLAEKNIKIELQILDPIKIQTEIIENRNYQALLFGNILLKTPDLFHFWHSTERFAPGLNLSLYQNKQVDALIESMRRADTSSTQRTEHLAKINELIMADIPALFIASPKYLYITKTSVPQMRIDPISLPHTRFENVAEWYVKTSLKFGSEEK